MTWAKTFSSFTELANIMSSAKSKPQRFIEFYTTTQKQANIIIYNFREIHIGDWKNCKNIFSSKGVIEPQHSNDL